MAGKNTTKRKQTLRIPGDVAAALAASKPTGPKPDLVAFIDNARNARTLKEIEKAYI